MKWFIVLGVLLFIVPTVYSATISGTVYDFDLDIVKGVVVEIDTNPVQRNIAVNGNYSFNVPEGDYVIKAEKDDEIAYENINVVDDGDFVLDLILFPRLDLGDELLEDLGFEVEEIDINGDSYNHYWIWGLIVLILVYVFWKVKKQSGKKVVENKSDKEEKKEIEQEIEKREFVEKKEEPIMEKKEEVKFDSYEEHVLSLLNKNDGRITQKEVRKEIPLSEAKISLIIADLENKGKVKKIKKGRGNIIVLI